MCTATYVPLADNGFLLTHSRDEKLSRPAAQPPRAVIIGNQLLTFPKDPQGQGTWIAQSETLTVCLLNGAFAAHQAQPPYRHSRGLVPLAAFEYASIDSFINTYPFNGLEPFTLLMAEVGRLVELRWNGEQTVVTEKDPTQPHIWSSATLYSPAMIRQRERWFSAWQQETPTWTMDSIRQFHRHGGDGNPHTAIRMYRPGQYQTVSLTTACNTNDHYDLYYEALPQPAPMLSTGQTVPVYAIG